MAGDSKDRRGGAGLSRPSRVVGRKRPNRSITLAAEVDAALAAESSRRGVSCSAVVEGVLREALAARGYDVEPTPPAAPARKGE